MASTKGTLLVYDSQLSAMLKLSDTELRCIISAMLEYHRNGIEPTVTGALLAFWETVRDGMDRNNEKWELIRAKRADAGRKGGLATQANASFAKQTKANQANASFAGQNKANQAVYVPVPVNVPVNANKENIHTDIKEKKDFFLIFASEKLKKSEKLKAQWEEWMKDRAERRKPVTSRAASGQWNILNGLTEDEAVRTIQDSIDKGYATFYPRETKGKTENSKTDICSRYRVFGGSDANARCS